MLNALLLHELAHAEEQERRGTESADRFQPSQRGSMGARDATIDISGRMSIGRPSFARRTTDGLDASR